MSYGSWRIPSNGENLVILKIFAFPALLWLVVLVLEGLLNIHIVCMMQESTSPMDEWFSRFVLFVCRHLL